MKESDLQIFIVGFIAYPIVTWLIREIFEKMTRDVEQSLDVTED